MLDTPYFARVDLTVPGSKPQALYIGLGNLMDEKAFQIDVHDWRAPVSSIFYRYETGPVSYQSPSGEIHREVTLKRQFEIRHGQLEYFFDSGVNITDDILRKPLSQNTSQQMRTIVETIQREQDVIIRDVDSSLVIVQGVAGSGKTSVALHRVAYLMYQGLQGSLKRNEVVLISPSNLFAGYISNVLSELGEEQIDTLTFEDLFHKVCRNEIAIQSKNERMEDLVSAPSEEYRLLLKDCIRFQLSAVFCTILDRLLRYTERHLVPFQDIWFGGVCIADRATLKERVLRTQQRGIPLQSRLKQLETWIMERTHAIAKERLQQIERIVKEGRRHPFEVKQFSRYLSTKMNARLLSQIRTFTNLDTLALYRRLLSDR